MDQESEAPNTAEGGRKISPIAKLFQLGRQQSYITYEDILHYYPHPEESMDQIERVFAALLCADIPFGEDVDHLDDDDRD